MRKLVFALPVLFLAGCVSSTEEPIVESHGLKDFLGSITLNDSTEVQFRAEERYGDWIIYNGDDESIAFSSTGEDSLHAHFPVYASAMWLKPTENGYKGEFYRTDNLNYRLPISFTGGAIELPKTSNKPEALHGQYLIERTYPNGKTAPALLQFNDGSNLTTGAIATSTGDTRYLSGYAENGRIELHGFDGRYIHNLKCTYKGDSVFGSLHTGLGGYYSFKGVAAPDAKLEDPNEMTELVDDFTHIEWDFPNLKGDTIHFDSRELKNPVILTVMGTWCPNCKDEARLLQEIYLENYGDIDVIGLSFEYTGDVPSAARGVQKMIDDLALSYPVVLAKVSRDDQENKLPWIEQLKSYPTTFIITENGDVVNIHTGFYGPSTQQYESFVKEYKSMIQSVITGEC